MPRGRKPKYPIGFTVREFLVLDQPRGRGRKSISQEDIEAALDSPFVIPTDVNVRPIRTISVHEMDLPSRAVEPLKALKICTVEQLLDARRIDLLAQKRFGEISLTRIRKELMDLLFPKYVGDGRSPAPNSFEDMVKCFVYQTIDNDRKAKLALGRLAPDADRPKPLREFGSKHDLSRERIRQIVDIVATRLRKPAVLAALNPFWAELCVILESWQRPVPLTRVADALGRRMHWQQSPPAQAVGRLLALNEGFLLNDGTVALTRLATDN